LLLAACSGAPKLKELVVAPSTASISVGQQQAFKVTGTYSNGTSKDLTTGASVTWASSKTGVATITSSGVATAVAAGMTNITASLGSITSSPAVLSVSGIKSIAVTPAFPTITVPGTQAFTAMAIIINPDGSLTAPQDITLKATWASSNTGVATIDSTQDATNGTATAVAIGLTQITATYEGVTSNIAYLTVGAPPPTVVQLTVAPLTATIASGQTIQFAATEVLSNGSTQPPSGPVSWSISCTPANTATIGTTTGLAVALASGAGASCTVTAKETAPNNLTSLPSTLNITAAVARFAYIVNDTGGTISAYAAGGALTFLAKYAAQAGLQQAIVHPSGNYLYVINGASGVQLYDINPVTGALKETGATSQAGASDTTDKGVIDPTGSFLYIVNGTDSAVYGFTINQNNGSLTATVPPSFSVGSGPWDVLVDHTGTYLYVINQGDQSISGFTITPLTGVLGTNNAATAPYTSGSLPTPYDGTIDPTDTYLYVTTGDGNVSSFQITSNGQLSTPGTVSPVAGATFLTNIVIDPSDKYIYVVDNGPIPPIPSNIYAFQVGTGGAFGAAIGSAVPAGITSFGMTIDPTSTLLAVDNQFSDTISLFSIGSNGALTSLVPASTGGAPLFLAFDIGTAAAQVTPAVVVTANKTTGDISAFTSASGVLTADSNAPYAGVAGNSQIGSSVTGSLFFTGSASGKQLAGYGFNAANTPAIAALSGSPYGLTPAGAAGTVIADPSNLFAYVADTTNAQVDIYSYNSTTNSLAAGTPSTGLTGLQSLVSDPQANFVFALSSNGSVTPIEPDLSTGGLSAGPPQAFAGTNWTMGAVDASGQYLLAVDSAANKIHMYSIGPAGSGTDGALAEIGSGTSIPGAMLPVAIAFDPLNRFVVVIDATAKTITPFIFTYDPLAPTLTAGTAVTLPSAAGQVTIDPTGKYLFVALVGAANSTPPSGVAVYTVAVSGGAVTLTPVDGSPFTTETGASGTTGVGIINSVQ
jgi:6-phosphogluconolactonase (cycloisomerase 2 family)